MTSRLLIILTLLGTLFVWLFWDVLLGGENFIYRDAGHFYYPLLQVVRDQWHQGIWPLWNPHENAGAPLLANPVTAVFYPPRILIFQYLPVSYGWAYKLYTLFHVLLAAATTYYAARSWDRSHYAAMLAAICYTIGGAILFQTNNIIFLVSAAWLPLSLLAIDRLIRQGALRWGLVLASCMSLQVLSGDPELAYLSGIAAALYACMFSRAFRHWTGLALVVMVIFRLVTSEKFATYVRSMLNGSRELDRKTSSFQIDGISYPVQLMWSALGVALAVVFLALLIRFVLRSNEFQTETAQASLKRLAIPAVFAIGLSAVQWLPTLEYSRLTDRAVETSGHNPYVFWIAPWRFPEFLLPNISGKMFPLTTRWLTALPLEDRVWEPSIYMGSIAFLFGLAGLRFRRATPLRVWLSLLLILSIWGSMGPSGGVGFYARAFERTHYPENISTEAANLETEFPNVAGGLYWSMVELLPGFGAFRFPAKLLTISCFTLAILASFVWDEWLAGERKRLSRFLLALGATSTAIALSLLVGRSALIAFFTKYTMGASSYHGPLDVAGTASDVTMAFASTGILCLLMFAIARFAGSTSRRAWLAPIALTLLAIELVISNQWMVVSAPQESVDLTPTLATAITQDAETSLGDDPYRIYRISLWTPPTWAQKASHDRNVEVFQWEKNTLQPKYAMPGLDYTINQGTMEPYDYWWFFGPFYANQTSEPIVYYPRRGFDLWGTHYFILPFYEKDDNQYRGIRTFKPNTELVVASPEHDYQVRRNLSAYPRAWFVHDVEVIEPIEGFGRDERQTIMRRLLYPGFDGLWLEKSLESQGILDPHKTAIVEHSHLQAAQLTDPVADSELEQVQILRQLPNQLELSATASSKAILVLAELYFPGWILEVDGQPAEILRVNRMMRGVALGAGEHHIVFRYQPGTFRIGGLTSIFFLILLAVAGFFGGWKGNRSPDETQSSHKSG